MKNEVDELTLGSVLADSRRTSEDLRLSSHLGAAPPSRDGLLALTAAAAAVGLLASLLATVLDDDDDEEGLAPWGGSGDLAADVDTLRAGAAGASALSDASSTGSKSWSRLESSEPSTSSLVVELLIEWKDFSLPASTSSAQASVTPQ